MRILVVCPELHRLGGVANHYMGLHEHWKSEVNYSFYGKRKDNSSKFLTILLYPIDFLTYIWKLIFHAPDVVIVNPSFRTFQLVRDGIYLLAARLLRIPVVTFIHGFDVKLKDNLTEYGKNILSWTYNKSTFIYVLSLEFKRSLESINITAPIMLTTTKVSESLLEGFVFQPKDKIKTLLFVARVIKDKGIYEAIDSLRIIQKSYPYVRLMVVGEGEELKYVKHYVSDQKISGVDFMGSLSGKSLADCYQMGDIYLLPTRSEGMATTILEAMAFGLPVITTPVGGVVDFFENGKNGFFIEDYDPEKYADIVMDLIDSPDKISKISKRNFLYAKENFIASKVVAKFEKDITDYLKQ